MKNKTFKEFTQKDGIIRRIRSLYGDSKAMRVVQAIFAGNSITEAKFDKYIFAGLSLVFIYSKIKKYLSGLLDRIEDIAKGRSSLSEVVKLAFELKIISFIVGYSLGKISDNINDVRKETIKVKRFVDEKL